MKWYGQIGFYSNEMIKPGVYEDQIVEREYYGDVLKNYKRDQSDSTINDEFTINNTIRVLSDPFLQEHYYSARYITFMGNKWKIKSIDFQWPAMTFEIGGLFNEEGSE